MITLPQVTVIGTLVADIELKHTSSGVAVTSFTIASNERRRDPDGNWVDGDATFLRCNLWREYAENVAATLSKGHRVIATGRLRQRNYEVEGQKRTVHELEVDEIGPALKWATAKVAKVARDGNGRTPVRSGFQRPALTVVDDEPPF